MKQKRERAYSIQHIGRPIAIGAGIGALCAFGYLFGILHSWSARVSDRLFLPHQPDPRIAVVAIDDASIVKTGRWPWDRSVHAELIRRISRAGAAVIAYDVNFSESQDASNDGDLASAIAESGNVVLPVELELIERNSGVSYDPGRTVQAVSSISSGAARSGFSNTPPDEDGIVRSIPLQASDPLGNGTVRAFGFEASVLFDPVFDASGIPLNALPGGRLTLLYPNAPHRAFPTISASDLLQGVADPNLLKDKLVFVGSTAPDLHDEQLVPTSAGTPMPGVEIHASLAHTILTRSWMIALPSWIMALALAAIGLLLGVALLFLRTRWSAMIAFGLWAVWLAASFIAFDRGVIVDIVWPTIAIVFSYAGVTIERRMTAERERRMIKRMFSQYVSPRVVESILKNPDKLKLGGDRRNMTIFFSDIRGFTSFTERMDAELVVQMLNAYLQRMTEIIFQYEGVLDKYMGDGVMAFWNAPFDQPDHAARAVRAALDMRDALYAMNRRHLFGESEWRIGMGLNTADVVVGNIGADVHTDYTVIGDGVNLTSRLESLTKEYGADILTTEDTVRALNGAFLVRRIDRVRVKGKQEPVRIYEVLDDMNRASMKDKERVVAFEEALNAYIGRRFEEAVSRCDAILSAEPLDGPARVLRERSSAFIVSPPPRDWDGTWVYTRK